MVDSSILNLVDKSTDKLIDLASYKEAKSLEEITRRLNPLLTSKDIRESLDFFRVKNEQEDENYRKNQFYRQTSTN